MYLQGVPKNVPFKILVVFWPSLPTWSSFYGPAGGSQGRLEHGPELTWRSRILREPFFWGHPLEFDILITWPRFSIFKPFRAQIRLQISDALPLTIAQIVNRWTSSREVSCDIASVIRAKMSQSFVDKTFVEQEIDQVQRKAGLPCPFQIQMPVK